MERRQYPRRILTDDEKCDIIIELEELTSSKITAEVVNISEAGIGLATYEKLNVGQIVNFIDKSAAGHKLPGSGRVMWNMQSKEGFTAGIQFTDLP